MEGHQHNYDPARLKHGLIKAMLHVHEEFCVCSTSTKPSKASRSSLQVTRGMNVA